MDSDDWDDVGETALWTSGPGCAGLVIALIIALLCWWMATSTRKEENTACMIKCGRASPVVVKTNAGGDSESMTCMCKWSDGSLHTGAPPPPAEATP